MPSALLLLSILTLGEALHKGPSLPAPVSSRTHHRLAPSFSQAGKRLKKEALRQYNNMQRSTYQHKTEVDEEQGVYCYDCSGFLDYSLKRVLREAYDALPVNEDQPRPLAENFYYHFVEQGERPVQGSPWQQVKRVASLKPGDVVAWRQPAESDSSNTGHVMLVMESPYVNPDDDQEMLVRIMDSTRSPHAEDSRGEGESGLGKGTIGLMVNAKGEPVAYKWRGGLSKKAFTTEIALGRVQ